MTQFTWTSPSWTDPPLDGLSASLLDTRAYALCHQGYAARGFVTLSEVFRFACWVPGDMDQIMKRARHLVRLFNGGATAQQAIARAVQIKDEAAANMQAWVALHGLDQQPATPLARLGAREALARLEADPAGFLHSAEPIYPMLDEQGRGWGFNAAWVRSRLASGQARMADFVAGRGGEVAVLVGNGPSLLKVDPARLRGTDVYLSNYALRDPAWRSAARGVAVTNRLVAAQEPALFGLTRLWRFHPVWLGHELPDSRKTVWLNAVGGPLFFAPSLDGPVAWHATVTFFWLQILFHVGYRRVVMIGFDHSYLQATHLTEGAVVRQHGDDLNHFLPGYFRDSLWQAADTDHMGRTYALARKVYEAAGREVVNSTEGGALEVLPRRPLADALRWTS